jgi:hypothetical protein
LEVLWEKRDQLEAARNELAALESKPGACNDNKERLHEEQKQIKLQIEAYRTVIASLQQSLVEQPSDNFRCFKYGSLLSLQASSSLAFQYLSFYFSLPKFEIVRESSE